jgi:hypothetical protein
MQYLTFFLAVVASLCTFIEARDSTKSIDFRLFGEALALLFAREALRQSKFYGLRNQSDPVAASINSFLKNDTVTLVRLPDPQVRVLFRQLVHHTQQSNNPALKRFSDVMKEYHALVSQTRPGMRMPPFHEVQGRGFIRSLIAKTLGAPGSSIRKNCTGFFTNGHCLGPAGDKDGLYGAYIAIKGNCGAGHFWNSFKKQCVKAAKLNELYRKIGADATFKNGTLNRVQLIANLEKLRNNTQLMGQDSNKERVEGLITLHQHYQNQTESGQISKYTPTWEFMNRLEELWLMEHNPKTVGTLCENGVLIIKECVCFEGDIWNKGKCVKANNFNNIGE